MIGIRSRLVAASVALAVIVASCSSSDFRSDDVLSIAVVTGTDVPDELETQLRVVDGLWGELVGEFSLARFQSDLAGSDMQLATGNSDACDRSYPQPWQVAIQGLAKELKSYDVVVVVGGEIRQPGVIDIVGGIACAVPSSDTSELCEFAEADYEPPVVLVDELSLSKSDLTITHELGHVFGLDHRGVGCAGEFEGSNLMDVGDLAESLTESQVAIALANADVLRRISE